MTIDLLPERLACKIAVAGPDDCWVWTAASNKEGYGRVRWGVPRRMVLAYRLVYELLIGPIPDGLTLDHLCRHPACVNPAHLEPVTKRENILRGIGPTAVNARKTHCKHGHEFDEANTVARSRGERGCRICQRASNRAWYARTRLHWASCAACGMLKLTTHPCPRCDATSNAPQPRQPQKGLASGA